MSYMSQNENLIFMPEPNEDKLVKLNVHLTKLFMIEQDQLMFQLKNPKLTGPSSSRPADDEQTDNLEEETALQSGFTKIKQSTNLVQYVEVPIIKNDEIQGQLIVRQAVIDMNDEDYECELKKINNDIDFYVKAASLSQNKIDTIRQTWNNIINKYGELYPGVLIFKNMFLILPGLKNQFPKFKMNNLIESDQLYDDDIFKVLAIKIINSITDTISLLDDYDKLSETLMNLGRIHENKGIPVESFIIFINAFNATIVKLIGKDSSIETINFIGLFMNLGTNLMTDGQLNFDKSRIIKYNQNEGINSQKYFDLGLTIKNFEFNQLPDDNGYDLILNYMDENFNLTYLWKYEQYKFANLNRLLKLKFNSKYDQINFFLAKPNYSITNQTQVLQSGQIKINQDKNTKITDSLFIMTKEKILGTINLEYEVLKINNQDIKEEIKQRIKRDVDMKLSSEKKNQLLQIWNIIINEFGKEQAGQTLFKNLFILQPSTKELFLNFKNISTEELISNTKFTEFASQVITKLTEIIELLEKPQELKNILIDLKNKHPEIIMNKELQVKFGNALNTSILAALKEDCTIEILRLFTLVSNELSDKLYSISK